MRVHRIPPANTLLYRRSYAYEVEGRRKSLMTDSFKSKRRVCGCFFQNRLRQTVRPHLIHECHGTFGGHVELGTQTNQSKRSKKVRQSWMTTCKICRQWIFWEGFTCVHLAQAASTHSTHRSYCGLCILSQIQQQHCLESSLTVAFISDFSSNNISISTRHFHNNDRLAVNPSKDTLVHHLIIQHHQQHYHDEKTNSRLQWRCPWTQVHQHDSRCIRRSTASGQQWPSGRAHGMCASGALAVERSDEICSFGSSLDEPRSFCPVQRTCLCSSVYHAEFNRIWFEYWWTQAFSKAWQSDSGTSRVFCDSRCVYIVL